MTVVEGGITIEYGVTMEAGAGFTISPSDFSGWNNGGGVTPNSNNGFTNNGTEGPGWNFYGVNLSANQGGNPTKAQEIYDYFVANGLNTNGNNSYIFDVSWGPGGSPTSTKVTMALYYNNPNSVYLDFGTVYTGDNVWETGGQDIYNSTLKSAQGTYNFPATFTLHSPLITNNSSWC